MHYIYKITNIINNKIYIGQTNNLNLRWSQHKSNAKVNNTSQLITKAMIKYGVDNFTFENIAMCLTQEDCNVSEQEIISQYNSTDKLIGYNVAPGGLCTKHTKEVLEKISKSLKEYYKTHKSPNYNKSLTNEWKKKLSISSMGKRGTNKGKIFSKEWRQKMSNSMKGRKFTKEHIKNMSISHMGNKASNRKLTFEQAEEIRKEYAELKTPQYKLGERYGISQDCVFNIIHRRTYNS